MTEELVREQRVWDAHRSLVVSLSPELKRMGLKRGDLVVVRYRVVRGRGRIIIEAKKP